MLAGLIFATEDADDRPGTLAATLPFGGLTLIEFQARLLIGAGASQIILVIARLTPELLGAINRIGRRGASVDAVRTAAEVMEKLHPLSRVLVVADGVMTTGDVLAPLLAESRDALLVTEDESGGRFERVGALTAWAGLALLDPKRIAEVAAMPKDYDFQSTLLRVTAQAGPVQVRLPAGAGGTAHSIERDSRSLGERGKVLLSALVPLPTRWAERYLLTPLSRLALPHLVGRSVPSIAATGLATLLAVAGFIALALGWATTGVALAIVAIIAFAIGATASTLRDERIELRIQQGAALGVPAITALLIGRESAAGWIAAGAAIVLAALVERAGTPRIRRRWWASPAAYPMVMVPFVAIGQPLAGLVTAGLYAAVTLAAAIEALREED